jgi:hypothetical protein
VGARHCLIVGPSTIIGSSAIIGNSCAQFPTWSVPCDPATIGDQTCLTVSFARPVDQSGSFGEPVWIEPAGVT